MRIIISESATYLVLSVVILCWLYVAARMIARGVLRSIEEWKDKGRKNGYKKQ